MKIAFIYPQTAHKKFEEDIDIVSKEFGTFPPLGLLWAAAINEQSGNKSVIIDANAEQLTHHQILTRVEKENPDMLGFLLTAYGFFDALNLIKFLKTKTKLPVIAGNVLCHMYPELVLQHREIDYICTGSAINSLPELTLRLKNHKSLKNLHGIGWKNKGQIRIIPPNTLEEDFNSLPFPTRHLVKNNLYSAVMSKRKNYTIMVTSKGCSAKCIFCHIHKIPISFRSAEGVVTEMKECHDKYNIKEMDIFDPAFTMFRDRVIDICKGIIRHEIDIHWACRARVDQVDEELLKYMHQAGCRRILYGIETGDETLLRKLNKQTTRKQAKYAVEMTKKTGIQPLGFFMLGVPGETLESLKTTIAYSMQLKVDYAQFHRTMAKPNTALHNYMNKHLGYDYWRQYISGKLPERRLPTPWTKLSDEQIQEAAKKAYHKFYFRPKYLLKLLLDIKSWDEFKRYLRSAIGLIFSRRDK